MREVARRSGVLAEALGQPKTAFKHQSVSTWLAGSRNPRPEHRRLLAMIFEIPLEELNRGCDGVLDEELNAALILREVAVYVHGAERSFEYRLTLRNDIDLSVPALYQHWAEIFRPWPAPLARHFSRLKHNLFGWVPYKLASPLVRHPRSLVPLSTRRAVLPGTNSIERQVWFVYLPGGKLDAGVAVREGRWLLLSKPNGGAPDTEKYPLSQVDLVGRVVGRALFRLGPAPV